MSETLRIALAQINITVGDTQGNIEKIRTHYHTMMEKGADLVAFPEMTVTGYPADDLVLRTSFQKEAMEAIKTLAAMTVGQPSALIVGSLWRENNILHNAGFLIEDGKVLARRYKYALPNYGVFDEKRHFLPGALPEPVIWRGHKLGFVICEELWHDDALVKMDGADFYVSINASPVETNKVVRRKNVARILATRNRAPLLYLNMICGQDDLVFDGQSFAMQGDGEYAVRFPAFREAVEIVTITRESGGWEVTDGPQHSPISEHEVTYQALVLGLRDYVQKNRFESVLLGLSGGIDSAITAAVAVDALGADKVHAVMMPSPYTSQESLDDASECARLLGIKLDTIPIGAAMEAFEGMLSPSFAGAVKDITEENLQARIRGTTLMALSNKFGHLLLTTGNKSEMAVGYATLYGDMCGGYSVLKDVYKTRVFELSRWRNSYRPDGCKGPQGAIMPERVITKPPSAELKPDQMDQDSLPPYDVLDGILSGLIEQRMSASLVVEQGYSRETVLRVLKMVTRAEYKRRQSPPGVKVTSMAFGRDWRYPITNRYKN